VTILGKISPFGLLFKGQDILGENTVCCRNLWSSEGGNVDVWGFTIKLKRKYCGIFWFGNCFGYFFQIWANYFPNLLVTLEKVVMPF
jgi:hypothetical protein